MQIIYLVRHAESIANTEGMYQGQTYNTGLSDLGKKQAKAFAKKCKELSLDMIIASPLKRTKVTAMHAGKAVQLPIIEEITILETNHGLWEGMKKGDIEKQWPSLYAMWLTAPSQVMFPGGESFKDTQLRVINWWKKLSKKGNVLIVTHDNIIRLILAHITKSPIDDIWKFSLHPTGITEIHKSGTVITIKEISNCSHLNGIPTNTNIHAL